MSPYERMGELPTPVSHRSDWQKRITYNVLKASMWNKSTRERKLWVQPAQDEAETQGMELPALSMERTNGNTLVSHRSLKSPLKGVQVIYWTGQIKTEKWAPQISF